MSLMRTVVLGVSVGLSAALGYKMCSLLSLFDRPVGDFKDYCNEKYERWRKRRLYPGLIMPYDGERKDNQLCLFSGPWVKIVGLPLLNPTAPIVTIDISPAVEPTLIRNLGDPDSLSDLVSASCAVINIGNCFCCSQTAITNNPNLSAEYERLLAPGGRVIMRGHACTIPGFTKIAGNREGRDTYSIFVRNAEYTGIMPDVAADVHQLCSDEPNITRPEFCL